MPVPQAPGRRRRVLILGAAGRDFHDFNRAFRERAEVEVVAFTAAQIPGIAGRRYPPELAGPLYPQGIPIEPEERLEALIAEQGVDEVVFAYSDVAHVEVMHLASRASAAGAGFRLLGPRETTLPARRPVVSVCAVRTGAGKSPAVRRVAALAAAAGLRVGVVRHPMPYGDLASQAVQRFARSEDLARAGCTVEEREEYEPHLAAGRAVYAGVDYERVLALAEDESDLLIWDGGNNDTPFVHSDLEIVCLDPQRAGHELLYHPGETNLRRAQVVLLTKLDTADVERIHAARASVARVNPRATVIDSAMPVSVDRPEALRGRRALVIEDGPTITHGGLPFGAGVLAARRHGARELVDPRPFAVGSLKEVYAAHPHIGPVLPAMGYGAAQTAELEATIRAVPCDVVVLGTPVDLGRLLDLGRPAVRVRYDLVELGEPTLGDVLAPLLARARAEAVRRG